MLVALGIDLARGAEPTLLVGLENADVDDLRAGEQLSITLRDAGLIYADEQEGREPRVLVIALGKQDEPKQDGRFLLTESNIEWMRNTTALSENLANLGFPEGKLVVFHGKTDEETNAAVRRYKKALARTLVPDTSVVTKYTLDKQTGGVTVERFERQPPRGQERRARADEKPSWMPIFACAVGAFGAFAGAFQQHDALGRNLCILIGVVLAAFAAWSLRNALRY
jgi:hypothetical protein